MKKKSMIAAAICSLAISGVSAAVLPRLTNPGSWLLKREAPADTLKRGERAMTAIDLTIASDGSVSECRIAYSSKSAALDEYACTLFKNNARYERAIPDQANVPREQRDFRTWEASKDALDAKTSKASPAVRGASSARWINTDDLPRGALKKDQVVVSNVLVTISPKGEVSACSVTLPSERLDLDGRVCALLAARAHYKPARDLAGKPTNGVDWMTIRWQVPLD
jgi:outer membrane biosynthesis protein TonB